MRARTGGENAGRRRPAMGAHIHSVREDRLWIGLLFVLALVAYLPALGGGWVWDDDAYILTNTTLRSPTALREIWLQPTHSPQYYPLVFTTFWMEGKLFGLDPRGYHWVNVLLHAAVAALALVTLRRLRVPGAPMIAAIFALHPVHVESVAWITERKNVLSALFYFAAALSYWRFEPPAPLAAERAVEGHDHAPVAKRDVRWYLLAIALFICALFSKTVTSTLPAALLLVFWWKRPRLSLRTVLPLLPFFALGAGFGGMTAWLERAKVGALGQEWAHSALERVVVAGSAFWFYPAKLLFPWPLTFIYPRWNLEVGPLTLLPAALAVTLLGLLFGLRGRMGNGPLFAALFYVVTILPALGFFNVYWMRFSFVADHFQYLASLGPLALVVTTWHRWRPASALDRPAAVAVLLALGILTFRQAGHYRNAETLWRDTLRKNQRAWIAHNNLGQLLLETGRQNEALGYFRTAIELNPNFSEAHNNLASFFGRQGKFEESVRAADEALRLDPTFQAAYFNRALARIRLGSYDAALQDLDQFERIAGPYARAGLYRGAALMALGRYDQAIQAFDRSLALDPSQNDVRAARAQAEQKRREGAAVDPTGVDPAVP